MELASKTELKNGHTLHHLYINELQNLYSAEQQILAALPVMIQLTTRSELVSLFEQHLRTSKLHLGRLEQIFNQQRVIPEIQKSEGIHGILNENKKMLVVIDDPDVRDAALISASQRVEHFEMARFGSIKNWADRLGYRHDTELLLQTIKDRKKTAEELNNLAIHLVNPLAGHEV